MYVGNPYGFVVRKDDDIVQTDHNLVHESCGSILARIEEGDDFGTLASLMNDHVCPEASDTEEETEG